jgi:hypothetical protein
MKKVAEVFEGLREEERRLAVELSGVRRAIGALEEVMGSGAAQAPEGGDRTTSGQGAPPADAGAGPAPVEVSGPYAGCGFYEAAAAYLSAEGASRTAREIAEALQAGGYETRAKNFTATVRTMLHRTFSTEPYGIYAAEEGRRWFTRE